MMYSRSSIAQQPFNARALAMLDAEEPDTEVIRRWLEEHLHSQEGDGKPTPAQVARHCEVTPQAVNGWKRTGRISKSNVELLSQLFGTRPKFGSATKVEETPGQYTVWPFPSVSPSRFAALPAECKKMIDSHALFVALQWEDHADGAAAA